MNKRIRLMGKRLGELQFLDVFALIVLVEVIDRLLRWGFEYM